MKEFYLKSETPEFHENGIFGSVPNVLYFLLRWLGFVEESDKKASHCVSSRILDILIFVTCADVCVSIAVGSEMVDKILIASYLSCHIVSAVVWYAMRFRRTLITSLLQNIRMGNSSFYAKVINFLVFINCCNTFLLPVFLINRVKDLKTLKFFFYGYDLEIGWLITIVCTLKFFLNYILYPFITNAVVLFYISLCWHCSVCINNLANEIARYTPEEFQKPKQLDILRNKAKMTKVLQNIQTIFSLPMFLIIGANFLICCSILAGSLVKIKFDEDNMIFIFYFLNAVLCVVTSVWVAGSIPIEMSRFKRSVSPNDTRKVTLLLHDRRTAS
ncbi:uncharacterized protein TNCT_562771 [Trichonephila clavata]|uniref:Uncharacterized protein n=1 Tax=Trichonephila clavata TaxID=2740835 RepID=A0A8X6LXV0_TRICU|nr:uncharacterized protein TNCT_562771 [Trichonephila clavata]